MYNGNVCCHYISSYIMTIFIFHYIRRYIMTTNISLYMKVYKRTYNDNKDFMIHENAIVIIQDDV